MPQAPDVTEMIDQRLKQAIRLIEYDLLRMVGKTVRDHLRDNFRQGGLINGGLHQWKDVKRRDPDSKWYGFEYRAEKRISYRFKRDPKTGRTQKADKQKQLNFPLTATRRPVLLSKRLELMHSITSRPGWGWVAITADKPYAGTQSYGGIIKVLGKHLVKLPAKLFIGASRELENEVTRLVRKELDRVFKQQR